MQFWLLFEHGRQHRREPLPLSNDALQSVHQPPEDSLLRIGGQKEKTQACGGQRSVLQRGLFLAIEQPEGWGKACRFIALRYKKKPKPAAADEPEQYQLFDTPEYTYRVFVTDMKHAVTLLVWFYDQRAGAENRSKKPTMMPGWRHVRRGAGS